MLKTLLNPNSLKIEPVDARYVSIKQYLDQILNRMAKILINFWSIEVVGMIHSDVYKRCSIYFYICFHLHFFLSLVYTHNLFKCHFRLFLYSVTFLESVSPIIIFTQYY